MMRYVIHGIAIFILATTVLSCGKAVKQENGEKIASQEVSKKIKSSEITKPEMINFPDAIFTDMKERFQKEGITLVSLKRNAKGKNSLIEATIKTDSDSDERNVPIALTLIAKNFSSIDKIRVVVEDREYFISLEKVNDVIAKCEENGDDVNSTLWTVVMDLKTIEDEKDKKVQAAGI